MSRAAGNESTSDPGRDPVGCVSRTTAASDAAPAKPRRSRRRWFQFSIRGLLLLTLLVAGLLSAWKVYLLPYERQKAAVAELDALGIEHHAKPEGGPRWLGWPVGEEHYVRVGVLSNERNPLNSKNERQRLLVAVDALPFLDGVVLRGEFTDDDLAHFRGLHLLTAL